MEELRLKMGQATKQVEQSEKAVAEKEAEAEARGVKVKDLKLRLESARVGCMGASAKEAEANALRVMVGKLEGELKAVGQGVVDVDGTDAGSRFAVLQETLRESKVTGARLTEQLSGAREALRSTKKKSREACEALQKALDEALLKIARLTNQGGWGGAPPRGVLRVGLDRCLGWRAWLEGSTPCSHKGDRGGSAWTSQGAAETGQDHGMSAWAEGHHQEGGYRRARQHACHTGGTTGEVQGRGSSQEGAAQ